MKYSIKPKNDSDKENAKQLELIMNNKSATYDDISEIIKERVDNFELKDDIQEERLSMEAINNMLHDLTEFGMTASYVTLNDNKRGICIQSIPMDICAVMQASIMKEPTFPANSNQYYPRKYASKDTPQIIDAILFQEEKQPKENHPHGWYRKFDKKRY